MITLILKMGEEKGIIDVTNIDTNSFLAALRNSDILDSSGEPWVIDSNEPLYFEAYPPHFEIELKRREP